MDKLVVIDGVRVPAALVEIMEFIKSGDLESASKHLKTFWSYDVERVVKSFGFKLLGQGAYSTVFMIPGQDTVIKMNHNPEDRWKLYAQFAKQNSAQNQMLPKVFELFENQENGMVIARLEQMQPIEFVATCGMWDVVVCLIGDMKVGRISKRGIRNRALKYLKTMFDFGYKGRYSDINLAKIVIWIAHTVDTHVNVEVDCHYGNWMLRGTELVLNDPIASD